MTPGMARRANVPGATRTKMGSVEHAAETVHLGVATPFQSFSPKACVVATICDTERPFVPASRRT